MILYRLRKFLNKKRKTKDCLWRAAKAGGKVHCELVSRRGG